LKELTVIDLFAGIGGFSYGLHNASSKFKTIAFAEIDQFCNKVLKKNFGNVKIYEDVRDVRIKQPVFLVCGGFPCQGFSVAGLQRGTKDNRYLWPEMFNVIKHTKPRWVIAENVRGIVNVENGMAFNKVHTDLESEGYEVQAFNIPAAAKGAWHRRERIWFVACNPDVVYPYDFRCEQHTEAEEKGNGRAEATPMSGSSSDVSNSSVKRPRQGKDRCLEEKIGEEERGGNKPPLRTETRSADVSDSEVEGLEGHDEHHSSVSGKDKKSHTGNESGGTKIDVWNTSGTGFKSRTNGQGQEQNGGASPPGEQCQGDWSEIIAQFRGIPNGVSSELDKTRTNRLKSLGNSIVPQIAEEIGRAIIKAEIKNGG